MLLGLAALAVAPARAQNGTDLFSAETVTLAGNARIVAADGEAGWLDGGLGKTRFDAGSASRDLRIRPRLAEADLIWQPHFIWSLSGTVVAIAQHGQERPIDLSTAALSFKPRLAGPIRFNIRAGLYWPDVSLEHSGPEWRVTDTITPSAINSWIGDEIKTGGVEATVTTPLGMHRVAATLGAFGLKIPRAPCSPFAAGRCTIKGDRFRPPAAATARRLHAGRPGNGDAARGRDRPSYRLVRQARLVALPCLRAAILPL
jgi:hypothetical protein